MVKSISMSKLIIEGTGGRRILSGEIPVSGAKNTALPILVSALLFDEKLTIKNLPQINDVKVILEILKSMGYKIEMENNIAVITSPTEINKDFNIELFDKVRGSIIFLGPLFARLKEFKMKSPGGCNLGERKIGFFIDVLKRYDAKISTEGEYLHIKKIDGNNNIGEYFCTQPSVTFTEMLILMACLMNGKLVIKNASVDPEITWLCEFLVDNGFDINGLNTNTITVEGKGLQSIGKGIVPPDRIETGIFLITGILTGKDLKITNCDPNNIEMLLNILNKEGVKGVEVGEDYIYISEDIEKNDFGKINALEIKTHEYPGMPTDMQAIMAVYMSQLNGFSFIFETIFERRFRYLNELRKFGILSETINRREVLIQGNTKNMTGAEVTAIDLRAGMACVLCAILAKGESVINDAEMIDRGHENIINKLAGINVKIVKE